MSSKISTKTNNVPEEDSLNDDDGSSKRKPQRKSSIKDLSNSSKQPAKKKTMKDISSSDDETEKIKKNATKIKNSSRRSTSHSSSEQDDNSKQKRKISLTNIHSNLKQQIKQTSKKQNKNISSSSQDEEDMSNNTNENNDSSDNSHSEKRNKKNKNNHKANNTKKKNKSYSSLSPSDHEDEKKDKKKNISISNTNKHKSKQVKKIISSNSFSSSQQTSEEEKGYKKKNSKKEKKISSSEDEEISDNSSLFSSQDMSSEDKPAEKQHNQKIQQKKGKKQPQENEQAECLVNGNNIVCHISNSQIIKQPDNIVNTSKISEDKKNEFLPQSYQNKQIANQIKNFQTKFNNQKEILRYQFNEQYSIFNLIPTNCEIKDYFNNLRDLIKMIQLLRAQFDNLESQENQLIQLFINTCTSYQQQVSLIFRMQNQIQKDDLKDILCRVKQVQKKFYDFQKNHLEKFKKKIDELNTQQIVNIIIADLKQQTFESKEDQSAKKESEDNLSQLKSDKLKFQNDIKENVNQLEFRKQILEQKKIEFKFESEMIEKEINYLKQLELFSLRNKGGFSIEEVNQITDKLMASEKENTINKQLEIMEQEQTQKAENLVIYNNINNDINDRIFSSSSFPNVFYRIFIADQSGSMGNAFQEVVESIIQCTERLQKTNPNDSLSVIKFDDKAVLSQLKSQISTIDLLRLKNNISHFSQGGTNFVSAFQQLQLTLQNLPQHEIPFIIFLTDGGDPLSPQLEKIIQNIQSQYPNLIFFALGYGSSISENTLKQMCNLMNNTKECKKNFGNGDQQLYFEISSAQQINQTYIEINCNTSQMLQCLLQKKSLSRMQYEEREKNIEEGKQLRTKMILDQRKLIQEQIQLIRSGYEENKDKVEVYKKSILTQQQNYENKMQEIQNVERQIQDLQDQLKQAQNQTFLKEGELLIAQNDYENKVANISRQKQGDNETLKKLGFCYFSQMKSLNSQLTKVIENEKQFQQQVDFLISQNKKFYEQCQDMQDQIDNSIQSIKRLQNCDQLEQSIYKYFIELLSLNIGTENKYLIREQIVNQSDPKIADFVNENQIKTFYQILMLIDYKDITSQKKKSDIIMKILTEIYEDHRYFELKNKLLSIKEEIKATKNELKNISQSQNQISNQIEELDQQIETYSNKTEKAKTNNEKERYQKKLEKYQNELQKMDKKLNKIEHNEEKTLGKEQKLRKKLIIIEKEIKKEQIKFKQKTILEKELIKRIISCLDEVYKQATQVLFWQCSVLPISIVLKSNQAICQLEF